MHSNGNYSSGKWPSKEVPVVWDLFARPKKKKGKKKQSDTIICVVHIKEQMNFTVPQ